MLKYLKSHFLEALDEGARYGPSELGPEGFVVSYVITVPAKWDNASRECIKTAAKKVCTSFIPSPYTCLFPLTAEKFWTHTSYCSDHHKTINEYSTYHYGNKCGFDINPMNTSHKNAFLNKRYLHLVLTYWGCSDNAEISQCS